MKGFTGHLGRGGVNSFYRGAKEPKPQGKKKAWSATILRFLLYRDIKGVAITRYLRSFYSYARVWLYPVRLETFRVKGLDRLPSGPSVALGGQYTCI